MWLDERDWLEFVNIPDQVFWASDGKTKFLARYVRHSEEFVLSGFGVGHWSPPYSGEQLQNISHIWTGEVGPDEHLPDQYPEPSPNALVSYILVPHGSALPRISEEERRDLLVKSLRWEQERDKRNQEIRESESS